MQKNPWSYKVDPCPLSINLFPFIQGIGKLPPLYLFFFPEMSSDFQRRNKNLSVIR